MTLDRHLASHANEIYSGQSLNGSLKTHTRTGTNADLDLRHRTEDATWKKLSASEAKHGATYTIPVDVSKHLDVEIESSRS